MTELKDLKDYIDSKGDDFRLHAKMFEILDGDLSKHLSDWLADQLSGNSLRFAKARMAPVNVLKKIIDKLSTIYQQYPVRTISTDSESDKENFALYLEWFKMNQTMNLSNEFFNLSRSCLLQPYVHLGVPRLRPVPNDRFVVYSDDPVDPLTPTHIMTCHGDSWHVWTKDLFFVMDKDAKLDQRAMNALENPEGINPIGRLPFVYINRSATRIMPPPDRDAYKMSMLIPGLLTDLNYASMFTMFSILYGIDIDNQNLEMAPNNFWKFYSDPATDKKPVIGSIKPEADITATLELVRSQMAMWLQAKNIKPGAVGEVEGSNFASAVSKMVDEADTTDERKKQAEYFSQAEYELWELIAHHLHPYWLRTGQMLPMASFSTDFFVSVNFRESIPLGSRGALIADIRSELDLGLITKKDALMRLNPNMAEEEVDDKLTELSELQIVTVRTPPQPNEEEDDTTENSDQDT